MQEESNKPTTIISGMTFGLRKITYRKAVNYYPAIIVKKHAHNKTIYSIQTIHAGRNVTAAIEKAIKEYEGLIPLSEKERQELRKRATQIVASKKAQKEVVKKIPKEFQKQFFTNLKEGF